MGFGISPLIGRPERHIFFAILREYEETELIVTAYRLTLPRPSAPNHGLFVTAFIGRR